MKIWLPQEEEQTPLEDRRILRVCKHAWPVLEGLKEEHGTKAIAQVIFIKDIVCQMINQKHKE